MLVFAKVRKDFWVKDYADMVLQIEKYHKDKSFYDKMMLVAKKRLQELTGEEGSFVEAVQKMLESPRFY